MYVRAVRNLLTAVLAAGHLIAGAAVASETPNAPAAPEGTEATSHEITVYKTPTCGCCTDWVDHLRANGFTVTVEDYDSLSAIKFIAGVPRDLESCHTAMVDGYVVEGHVPAGDIVRLLTERPAALGLSVPGMPIGSPGMEVPGRTPDAYDVILFGDDRREIFNSH
jgi:hypothetical protein